MLATGCEFNTRKGLQDKNQGASGQTDQKQSEERRLVDLFVGLLTKLGACRC